MVRYRYVHVPEQKRYYKAQENCCLEVISLEDEKAPQITWFKDDENYRELNSWNFFCLPCNSIEMKEITEEVYLKIREGILKSS